MMINSQSCTERSVSGALRRKNRQNLKALSVLVGLTFGYVLFAEPLQAEGFADANNLLEGALEPSAVWIAAVADEDEDEEALTSDDSSNEDAGDSSKLALDILQQVEALATEARALSQTAATAQQWDAVVAQWIEVIALLQSIPPESPARILAQRQLRGYLLPFQDAQQRAEQSSPSLGLSSLGSDLFDAQLAGYLSYVATVGQPDVLIVGSSRALQGIDPQALQQALAAQGYADLNVFNLSVNGATAQVVEFVVGLLPEPLPPVIVWGDGSRAFNEGRRDRTWESLRASPGYQASKAASNRLVSGFKEPSNASSSLPMNRLARRVTANSPLVEVPGNLDALGFSAVSDRFDPQTYYQQIPRVEGRYDGAYEGFALNGTQADALGRLAVELQGAGTQLVFVNLPLSGSYLDNFRLYYEQQFQRFLQAQGNQYGFEVVDLLTQWETQPGFFADPSHINRDGASAISRQLAQQPILTNALSSRRSPAPPAFESPSLLPASEPPANRRLDRLLRPAQTSPTQRAPIRRPPPPIPPPPTSPN